jgi:hypothetical protein
MLSPDPDQFKSGMYEKNPFIEHFPVNNLNSMFEPPPGTGIFTEV